MSDRGKGWRRVVGPRKRDPEAERPRAARSGGESDIEEERRRHAADDTAIAEKRAIGYETTDVKVRSIVVIGVASAVFLALVSVGIWGMFNYFASRPVGVSQPASALPNPTTLPPEPRLQVDPPADWQALRATEEALLNTYSWADQASGTVRLPIDRAMDLLAERGLPVRSGSTRQFGGGQQNLDSSGGQEVQSTSTPPGGTGSAP